MDLHTLVLKTAMWKFYTMDIDDAPDRKFQPEKIIELAYNKMALSLRALQQRVVRAKAKFRRTGSLDPDGDWETGVPLITGRAGKKLKLERNFFDALHGLKITAFLHNPKTKAQPYRPPKYKTIINRAPPPPKKPPTPTPEKPKAKRGLQNPTTPEPKAARAQTPKTTTKTKGDLRTQRAKYDTNNKNRETAAAGGASSQAQNLQWAMSRS